MKYLITIPALCFILLTLSFPRAADALAKEYPVTATVAGLKVDTTVDSIVARHVIRRSGHQLPHAQFTDLSSRLTCGSIHDLPSTQNLQRITADYSPDTATALLIQCLIGIPRVRKSQALFLSELEDRRNGSPQQAHYIAQKAHQYMVLFVPGWDYHSNGDETGSDLRVPRKIISAMGFENHLVPIEENGSVEENAAYLVKALAGHLQAGKKIILVSASSGGPTVALALGDSRVRGHPLLAGWLNICGVLRGSPIIDNFHSWPKSWLLRAVAFFEGWDYENLTSLSHSRGKSRYARFTAPSQLTIVNYIGIPFSGQLSEFGRPFYGMLNDLGPNDGLTLITEALAPGYTVMAVGTDHFVNEDPDIDIKTAALVPVLLKLIEG